MEKNGTHQILLEHSLFIVWQPEYDLGIPIIDEQHRGIVTTINSLHFGIQNNYIEDIFAPIINMMYDYTQIHFQIEEALLKKIDFSHAKKHHELHHELIVKLANIGKKSILSQNHHEFMEFLKEWWINHICNEDLIYRDYLLASAQP